VGPAVDAAAAADGTARGWVKENVWRGEERSTKQSVVRLECFRYLFCRGFRAMDHIDTSHPTSIARMISARHGPRATTCSECGMPRHVQEHVETRVKNTYLCICTVGMYQDEMLGELTWIKKWTCEKQTSRLYQPTWPDLNCTDRGRVCTVHHCLTYNQSTCCGCNSLKPVPQFARWWRLDQLTRRMHLSRD